MAKRSIEEVIAEVRLWRERGMSTFQAMACTMNEQEWDDLLELIDRLQDFWKRHADAVSAMKD